MGSSVGLVMIVKNEERTLPRLAASVRDQLDHWTIVDTGSTDATPALTQQLFDGVPGQLVHAEWRGFGPARTIALQAAAPHSDWLLMLDADETIDGVIDRDRLAEMEGFDCVEVQRDYAGLSWWMPLLLRSERPWECSGRAHEHLRLRTGEPRAGRTTAFRAIHHADGGNRADKLPRELSLLQEDLADQPDDPRTTFYLARTHEDLGQIEAAAALYRRRIELGGWDEETWYAQWRLGRCLLGAGASDEACGVLWRAFDLRPWRAEPLSTLATHYRETAHWRLCWEACALAARQTAVRPLGRPGPFGSEDRLFVHTDVYDWRVAYEQSVCAWYVSARDVGRRLSHYLLGRALPAEHRASVEASEVGHWFGAASVRLRSRPGHRGGISQHTGPGPAAPA